MKKILGIILSVIIMTAVLASCSGGVSNEIIVVSREDGSGTRGAFTELMGIEIDGTDNTTEEATFVNSTSVVMATVAGNEQSIGYISLGSLDDTIKALSVDGAEATVENIQNDSYPVYRNFNIATKGEVSEAAQDFIDYILSDEGQAVVEEAGFISIDSTGTFNGGDVSGKVVVGGSTSVAPVMEKLQEAYNVLNPNVEIEVHLGGSGTGMQQTMDGTLDIGMASRELKDSEKAELDGIVIAIDGIAVVVNNNNLIDNLTSEQIRQIFTGEITTWNMFD
ncbi:MAG: substrate-binding domain-containing protein [Caldicoprobacterales bacterium]